MIGKTPRISLLMPRLPACGRKHGKSRPTYLPHISLTPEGNFEKFQKCLRWAWANICPIWTAEGRVGHCSRAPLPSPRPAVAALPPWSKSQFSERGNWGEKELCLHSPPPPPLPGEWIRKRFESEKVMGLLGEALEGERGTRARDNGHFGELLPIPKPCFFKQPSRSMKVDLGSSLLFLLCFPISDLPATRESQSQVRSRVSADSLSPTRAGKNFARSDWQQLVSYATFPFPLRRGDRRSEGGGNTCDIHVALSLELERGESEEEKVPCYRLLLLSLSEKN